MTNPASPEPTPGNAPESAQSSLSLWYLQYWPALIIGVLLSMGIMGINGEQIPAILIWLPALVAVFLLILAILRVPRAKKHKETAWEKRARQAALKADAHAGEHGTEQTVAEAAPVAEAPAPQAAPVVAGDVDVLILWGSETGTAQGLAEMTENRIKEAGKSAKAISMANIKLDQLPGFGKILLLTSTWGDGEPPSNAIDLWEAFQKQKADLSKTGFSVLAIGDTGYPLFCKCGKDFDEFFAKMGAQRIFPRVDCDLDYEANFEKWLTGVQKALA